LETLTSILKLDPSEVHWSDLGACRGMDIKADGDKSNHPFFELYESDLQTRAAVDELCNNCPVQRECGEYGMENREEGVWGGVYLTPGGKVHRVNNSHKSRETWDHINKVFGRRLG
jgi:hypothetical protein